VLAADPPEDLLVVVPGLVRRRDSIDRLHVGEPHQLDLWRITRTPATEADLRQMIEAVVEALIPHCAMADGPGRGSVHASRAAGRRARRRAWVELLECG
jgi:phenylalanyl-tRNA synthetase alpha chain